MADWWDDGGFGGDWGFGGFGDTGGSYTPTDYSGFEWASPVDTSAWTDVTPTFDPYATTGAGGLYGPAFTGLPAIDVTTAGGNFFGGYPGFGGAPQQQPLIPSIGALGGLNSMTGLLGLGGSLAGLAGTLMGGGRGATTTPQLPTAARAQIGQANQAIQPFATGQSPLQQMQMSLLQSIAGGQGLPPGYAQLVEQAFQPKLGSLYEQAVNAGRARGFHDAPGTSPAGGAVLGPGLADLQGQMAAAKLGLMQSLPGLYNQPINQQIGAAQGQSSNLLNAAQLQRGQTTSQPLGSQIGRAIGGGLQGMGQAITMSGQQQSRPWNLYGPY